MNKLLLTLKRDYNDSIILVANNHKDLEDYLRSNYDFYKININDDSVIIVARENYETEYGTLEWIRQV
jgi:hypothetical protein